MQTRSDLPNACRSRSRRWRVVPLAAIDQRAGKLTPLGPSSYALPSSSTGPSATGHQVSAAGALWRTGSERLPRRRGPPRRKNREGLVSVIRPASRRSRTVSRCHLHLKESLLKSLPAQSGSAFLCRCAFLTAPCPQRSTDSHPTRRLTWTDSLNEEGLSWSTLFDLLTSKCGWRASPILRIVSSALLFGYATLLARTFATFTSYDFLTSTASVSLVASALLGVASWNAASCRRAYQVGVPVHSGCAAQSATNWRCWPSTERGRMTRCVEPRSTRSCGPRGAESRAGSVGRTGLWWGDQCRGSISRSSMEKPVSRITRPGRARAVGCA